MIKDKSLKNSKQKIKDAKKESKHLLLEDEESFFLLFDNSPYPIFLLDRQGIIEDINSAAIKLLKYDKNQIKGRSFTELLEGDSKKIFKDEFRVPSKKRKAKRKLDLIFKDKKDNNVTCSTLLVTDKKKGNGESVLFAQDMTELEKTQKAFHFKSELLTSLLDNTPDHIYFKDKNSRFIEISKSKADQVGLSREKVLGKSDFDFYKEEEAKTCLKEEKKIIKTGCPIINKEELLTTPDSKVSWTSTTKIPRYDEKGRIIGTLGISRDITEKKELEEKLKRRVEQLGEEAVLKSNLLTSLLDNLPDCIFFKDMNSRFIRVNKAKASKAGKEEPFFIGKTDFDFFPKDEATEMFRDEEELIAKGKGIIEKEYKVTRSDGKEEWALVTKVPLYDEKGNIIGTLGISRDITEKKELEEKLKNRLTELGEEVILKSNLLSSLLDNIPDYVYFKDRKSRFVEISKSKARQVGLSRKEVLGTTDFDYFTKEHAEEAYRDEQKIIKTGKAIKAKLEKETHPDGRITWVSTTKVPRYDEKGKVIGSLGISRDITDRVIAEKRLEESANKLKTIVNAVSEGLAIVDENHLILEANEFLAELFGLKREDIINKKCNQVFGYWEEGCENCPLGKLFKNRENFPVVEKTKVSKNGTIRYFNIRCYPIPNKALENPKSVISISDITERKNMEKKNIQNYKRKMKNLSYKLTLAEEHERKRIATALHADVGQTLAFLTLKTSELKEKEYPKNIKKELEEVYDLAQNAMTSTRLLMRQLSPAILYELGFVPAVDWLAESILRESNIRYRFKDDGEEKPLTDDLSVLLFQAVREILVNVKKHAKAKNVKIFIKRSGKNIQIEIRDDGIGFDTSTLDSYVERDIGFGLLNIRSRIDVVGGHFEIESHKNKGTKVKLKAPLNI